MTEPVDLSSRMEKSAIRRHLMQYRINDADWELVQDICKANNIKAGSLAYEFFQFAKDHYLAETEDNLEDKTLQEDDGQIPLPFEEKCEKAQ